MRIALLGAVLALATIPVPSLAQDQTPAPPPAAQLAGTQESDVDVGPVKHLKFSGVLQVWYQAGDQGFADTFRLRRLRLYASGDITSRARFMVMIDPARALAINEDLAIVAGTNVVTSASINQATRILQDAYITLAAAPHLDVQVGQFKLPLNVEGSAPVQDLPLVERSLMTTDRARGGQFGDLRDIGVMARGAFANGLEYRVGVFNGLGTGQNDVDKDDRKAVAARLAWRTPVPGLRVGAFAASDTESATGIGHRRTGVDLSFQRGTVLLQGEFVNGRDAGSERRGYYAMASWRVRPTVEATARLDVWDPDRRADSATGNVLERDYAGGVSYYVSGSNLKWQAEYLRKTYASGVVAPQHVFLSNLQVAW
jgi:hypothetical protein